MTTRSGHEASTALAPELRVQLREGAPLEAVATAVRACAIGNGVGVERSTKLQVLVEELLREARRREVVVGDEAIDVEVVFDGGTFLVRVLDSRLPLTSREVRQLGSRRLVAMGFADALSTRYRPSEGNLAECSLDLTRADGRTIGDEVIGPDAPDAPDEVADHLAIGPLEAADIPDLIRCVYRCYGYTYCEPAFYDERHIRRLLAAGLMHSVVAKTMEGEVVGHCALTFAPGGLVPEAGRMIVDPRFRGHHLAEQLAAARNDRAIELGVTGVLCHCVSNHTGSQVTALRRGAVEVGVLIGATDPATSMPGLPDGGVGRGGLVVMYNRCGPPSSSTLVAPKRHAPMLRAMADELGLERSIETARHEPSEERTVASSAVSWVDGGRATIEVTTIGHDLLDVAADALEGFEGLDLPFVSVELPGADPSAAWAIDELERDGFTFASWLPDARRTGDVLCLQRVSDRVVDLEGIRCARPEGEQLRDAVIAAWLRVREVVGE